MLQIHLFVNHANLLPVLSLKYLFPFAMANEERGEELILLNWRKKRDDLPDSIGVEPLAPRIRRIRGHSLDLRLHLIAVHQRENEKHNVGHQQNRHWPDEESQLAVRAEGFCNVISIETFKGCTSRSS